MSISELRQSQSADLKLDEEEFKDLQTHLDYTVMYANMAIQDMKDLGADLDPQGPGDDSRHGDLETESLRPSSDLLFHPLGYLDI